MRNISPLDFSLTTLIKYGIRRETFMKKIANTLSVVLVLVLCAGLSISVSAKQTSIQYNTEPTSIGGIS